MKVIVNPNLPEHFIGFFEHARRRPGDVFSIPETPRRSLFPAEQKLVEYNDEAKASYATIKDADGKVPQVFSFRWMVPVAAATPERVSTAQQTMDKRSEQIKQEKAGARAASVGGEKTDDVI